MNHLRHHIPEVQLYSYYTILYNSHSYSTRSVLGEHNDQALSKVVLCSKQSPPTPGTTD